MTNPATVSVIVVSRQRPAELARCMAAIAQLDHTSFEVVVVADPGGIETVSGLPVKAVAFDQPNISAARNAGIVVASGEIVAFIDDDAVPEPCWLSRLVEPFADPAVSAATGFVRGRNGISYQWRARSANVFGEAEEIAVDPQRVSLHRGKPGKAIRTEGTNAAFRRSVLAALGGFDPAYRFYLDETDLNMRLAAAGNVTAIVPAAEVHHGFAASAYRRADRVPTDLYQIGASSAVFWRRHAPRQDSHKAEARLVAVQRARLIRHMVSGAIEPRDVARLMQTLAEGLGEGRGRNLRPLPPIADAQQAFRQFPTAPRPGRILSGRIWQARRLRARAAAAVAQGAVVSLFLFSPSARPHRVKFNGDGVWEQGGGLFGPSDRSMKKFQFWTFSSRLRHEIDRISVQRPIQG
jgi:GT2 family glycosyltransferase